MAAASAITGIRELDADVSSRHLSYVETGRSQPSREMVLRLSDALEIPLRGHIQVRVGEVIDRRMTLLTVAGHPLAGAVRFVVEPRGDALRFEIQVYDRAASTVDQILMRTVGEWLQRGAWVSLAQNVAKAAGGQATDVETLDEELDEHESEVVDRWTRALSAQLSRNSTSSGRD